MRVRGEEGFRRLENPASMSGVGDPGAPSALEFQLNQTIYNRPEHERNQQDIDAPHHPQNQRPKIVPAKESSEPLDGVKQWMFHGCHTRVSGKTQWNSGGVNRTLDDETNHVAGASKSERIGAFLEDHERATVFLQRYGSGAAAPSEKSTAHPAVTRCVEGSSRNLWSKHIYLDRVMAIIRRGTVSRYYRRR